VEEFVIAENDSSCTSYSPKSRATDKRAISDTKLIRDVSRVLLATNVSLRLQKDWLHQLFFERADKVYKEMDTSVWESLGNLAYNSSPHPFGA
jgi:hypothetical protein